MNVRDLVAWNRHHERDRNAPATQSVESGSSLLALHREVNRLFDDVFRDVGGPALWGGRTGWPHIEVEDSEAEYRVTAELPGMEEKDVEVLVQDGVLILRGEKRAENQDRARAFSERIYGVFERRLVLEGADEDRVQAQFRNGVLTAIVPKSAQSRDRVKRIPINPSGTTH